MNSTTRIAGNARATGFGIILLAFMLVSMSPATAAGGLLLEAAYLSFDTGCWPTSVAIGDLNGDGRPDLAVANSNANTVSVLLGNGDGTLRSKTDYPTTGGCCGGGPPSSVAIGDLNGDGSPDLAVANAGSNSVSILLGNGDGAFQPKSDYAAEGNPDFVAIGDLNGDGKPDLALGHYGPSNTVSVLLGNGDGTFLPHTELLAGSEPLRLAIGDLNGDAKPDLVVANHASNNVSVLLGNGDGTFAPKTNYGTMSNPSSVAIGDLNGDGKPDLATTGSALLGNGDGTFGPPIPHVPSGTAMGDLNHDGKLDLASGGWVLLGNGNGTFGAAMLYWEGSGSVAMGDVNGDGKPDLAVTDVGHGDIAAYPCALGTVLIFLGNGDGAFGVVARDFATGGPPHPNPYGTARSVAIADLDGDRKLDVAATNPGSNTVSVLLGDGNGALGLNADYLTGSDPSCVAIGDLNADGSPDLVIANRVSNTISVLMGNGNGMFGPRSDYGTGTNPRSVAIGDLNQDAKQDLFVGNYLRTLSVLLGRGDGTFGPRTDYEYPWFSSWVAIGDLNGDARPDLVVADEGSYDMSPGGVGVLLGNGDGTFQYGGYYFGIHPRSLAIGDLNGDGRPDLAVGDVVGDYYPYDSPPDVRVLFGKGGGTFVPGGSFVTRGNLAAITDLDGDGRPDLVGAGSRLSVLLGNGDGAFASRLDYGCNASSAAAIGDLNGDGGPDVVTASSTANTVSVQLNIGPGRPTPALLSLFSADWTHEGIELRWRFGAPGGFAEAAIERGDAAQGPWTAVDGERRDEGETSIFIDPGAEAGRTYYYRLVATRAEGGTMTFGPLAVTAGAGVSEFGLMAVAPNPGLDRVRFEFVVAREAQVRLSVLDVQGRRVALLADGVHPPGRYQAAWDGSGARGRAVSGLYFARYEAAGGHWVQRFTLLR